LEVELQKEQFASNNTPAPAEALDRLLENAIETFELTAKLEPSAVSTLRASSSSEEK
jgi:hypothetical protein